MVSEPEVFGKRRIEMLTKTLVGVGLAAALALPAGAALAWGGDGTSDPVAETVATQVQDQLRLRDGTCLLDGTSADQAVGPQFDNAAGDQTRDRLHADDRVGDMDRAWNQDQLRDPDQCLLDGSGDPTGTRGSEPHGADRSDRVGS